MTETISIPEIADSNANSVIREWSIKTPFYICPSEFGTSLGHLLFPNKSPRKTGTPHLQSPAKPPAGHPSRRFSNSGMDWFEEQSSLIGTGRNHKNSKDLWENRRGV
ncbi:MAG: hypothetical protein ACI814_001189 [Mariniblastus sp.]|jgi:hypothetical protein